jgi:hypothetical protein
LCQEPFVQRHLIQYERYAEPKYLGILEHGLPSLEKAAHYPRHGPIQQIALRQSPESNRPTGAEFAFAFAKRQPAHGRSMDGLTQRRCRTRRQAKRWCRNKLNRFLAWVSPADSFGTAIGVGIGIGVGIEPTNPLSAKLLADRVATLSELREHGHTTIEQCLLLAVVVCAQRIAHQRARPESQRTPAPSLVRFQTTGVDPRSSLCRYPR